MAFPKLFSLHPKLAAGIDAAFYVVLLWWVLGLKSPLMLFVWFVVRMAWWGVLIQMVYYPPFISRSRHLFSLFIFNLGILPYLVFVEAKVYPYMQLFSVLVPAVSFWLIPAHEDSLSVMIKPHRRWKFFMSLLGISGVWLFIEAGTAFQIFYGWQVAAAVLLACLITAGISFWEWHDYGIPFHKNLLVMLLLIFLVFVELGAIIYLWPIGYFVASFFIAWIWYILWLMLRFQLSSEGIDWSRQKGFLITNVVFISIFLNFVVRWK